MTRTGLMAAALLGTLLVAACTGTSATKAPSQSPIPTSVLVAPSGDGPPSTAPSAEPSAELPAASPSDDSTETSTTLDPCELVTVDEASALAGTTFDPGEESDTGSGGKKCVYGSETKNVFTVLVGLASSEAIARADEVAAEAALSSLAGKGLKFTEVKSFAPGADAAYFVGPLPGSLHAAAIYVLAGTTFFGFSDVVHGGAAPSLDDIEAQANVVLGRIP